MRATRNTNRAERGLILYWTYNLADLTENIYKGNGPEKVLWPMIFSEPRIEIIYWEMSMKKTEEISAGPKTFVSCVYTLQNFAFFCVAKYCQYPAVTREFRLLHRG
jgi:hypothetical protein